MIAPAQSKRTPPLSIPASYNYIGAFLTFACPFRCEYCINRHGEASLKSGRILPAIDWLFFFEQLDTRNVPVTLQGGEPGLHPDFILIVEELLEMHEVDILTNLAFDLKRFVQKIDPNRINRDAPYAPIRVSFHPSQFSLAEIVGKVLFLQKEGFRTGLYAVEHPENAAHVDHARKVCQDLGIDFRTKPFLGRHNGELYGEYSYPDACSAAETRKCECATSELLIAPDGWIYPCHHHLYNRIEPLDHISHSKICLSDAYHPCCHYGHCNPCDVKVKNNRFQKFGHTSMKIRMIEPSNALIS